MRGQIHIRANLATREDRGIPEEDNWTDIKQHVELLQIFIDHQLKKFKVKLSFKPFFYFSSHENSFRYFLRVNQLNGQGNYRVMLKQFSINMQYKVI